MHNKYIFSNIVGVFVFSEHFKLLDKKMFSNSEQYADKENIEKEFSKKYKNLKKPSGKELENILVFLKDEQFFDGFYAMNMELTKKLIKDSVKDDLLIIQTISSIREIDRIVNIMIKRLREWYALHNPEFEHSIKDQEKFVELVISKDKKELLGKLDVDIEDSMGAEFTKDNLEPIINLAKEVNGFYSLKKKQVEYLDGLMKKVCPNMLAITGSLIGAKLMDQAGGLKNLMEFPASTIQLLGAEKALFRHMKTGAKSPKFGFLHEHPLISQNPKQIQGKIARTLADKICLAVKVDYFKGEFIGDKLLKKIEDKFK